MLESSASLSDRTAIMIDPTLCSGTPVASTSLPTTIKNGAGTLDETVSVEITSTYVLLRGYFRVFE